MYSVIVFRGNLSFQENKHQPQFIYFPLFQLKINSTASDKLMTWKIYKENANVL